MLQWLNNKHPEFWKNYTASFKEKTTKFVVLSIESTGLNTSKDAILGISSINIINDSVIVKDALEIYIAHTKSEIEFDKNEFILVSKLEKKSEAQAIEELIIKYFTRPNPISTHKHLLDMLKWEDEDTMVVDDFSRAIACPLNHGIPELNGSLEAYIYVDDIMGSAVGKFNILRLLAATIKAIFAVCGRANIEVRQCSLSIKKWEQLVIGPIQTVLGLTVDTNKLTVAITQEYRDEVRELLTLHWPISRRIFKVADIQKLVGKLARLGEGAPWIYKIMSHIYTSLAFALKQNKELLLISWIHSEYQ